MGVLVQVLRGGGVSESLYLLVVSLFLWLFWGGGHPSEGRGGGCHRCAAGCCFVLRRRGVVLLRRRGGVLLRRRGGVLLRASSARRGAASCFVGAEGGRRWWHEKAAQCF